MNKSTILTCIGIVGVVATAVMSAKAAPKAKTLLEQAEAEKGEKLTKMEVVKTAGPVYIPAILMGASTIACIAGANILNTRSQAAITSAYALLDNSYKEFRNKANELYGEDAEESIKEEIAKDHYEENEIEIEEGERLFFDFNAMRYFKAKMEDVIQKFTTDDGLECYIVSTPFSGMEDYYLYESRY